MVAAANVLEQVSTMPVKYISRLEEDLRKVGGSDRDTVCIDFCAGNDACVLTTINTVLSPRGISLEMMQMSSPFNFPKGFLNVWVNIS